MSSKEQTVLTNRGSGRLRRPPAETLEALASVMGAHWRAAAKSRAARLFWTASGSWLHGHHFTTGGRLIRYASGSASVLKPKRVPRSYTRLNST